MPSQLFATKSIAEIKEADAKGQQLHRTLSATALTLLGIGGIIGTGIFVLTGTAAANHAGPALALSFIVAGLGFGVRRALLRGVLRDDPGDRQRVFVLLRDAR